MPEKVESEPYKQKIEEIQARYNELIGNNKSITGIALKAEEACNAALKPYLMRTGPPAAGRSPHSA